jgi:hypothetical protein
MVILELIQLLIQIPLWVVALVAGGIQLEIMAKQVVVADQWELTMAILQLVEQHLLAVKETLEVAAIEDLDFL